MGEDVRGLQIQLSAALRERDEARREIVRLGDACIAWGARVDEMDAARTVAESERDALRGDLAGTQEAMLALRVDYQREKARADAAEKDAAELRRDNAVISKDWDETQEALAAARRECDLLRSALRNDGQGSWWMCGNCDGWMIPDGGDDQCHCDYGAAARTALASPAAAPAAGPHAPYCCADAKAGGPDHSMDCPHFAAKPLEHVAPAPWRIGNHYGIHVYCGEVPIATFHTVADAKAAVRAYNASLDSPAQAQRAEAPDPFWRDRYNAAVKLSYELEALLRECDQVLAGVQGHGCPPSEKKISDLRAKLIAVRTSQGGAGEGK